MFDRKPIKQGDSSRPPTKKCISVDCSKGFRRQNQDIPYTKLAFLSTSYLNEQKNIDALGSRLTSQWGETMYTRMLIPLDGSKLAENVLPYTGAPGWSTRSPYRAVECGGFDGFRQDDACWSCA